MRCEGEGRLDWREKVMEDGREKGREEGGGEGLEAYQIANGEIRMSAERM